MPRRIQQLARTWHTLCPTTHADFAIAKRNEETVMKGLNRTSLLVALAWAAVCVTGSAIAGPTIYNDEAAFRAAAGTVSTYGFEVHGLAESTDIPSPVAAANLDNAFELAHTGLNAFQIVDNAGSSFGAEGTHFLFTHSQAGAQSYTLTFSTFGGVGAPIVAFGLTVVDFASNIQTPAAIGYSAGAFSGTLLFVPGGQPDYTQNFVGLIVAPAEAFSSITLTLDDLSSGFQSFDEVIFARQAAIGEPSTVALVVIAALLLLVRRMRRRVD
jgi:hypothetical protein